MNNIIRSNVIGQVNLRKICNHAFRWLSSSSRGLICLILRRVKTVSLLKVTENIYIGTKNRDNRDKSLVYKLDIKILVNEHQTQDENQGKSREMFRSKRIKSSERKPLIARLRDVPIARNINIFNILNICHLLIKYGQIQDLIWSFNLRMRSQSYLM